LIFKIIAYSNNIVQKFFPEMKALKFNPEKIFQQIEKLLTELMEEKKQYLKLLKLSKNVSKNKFQIIKSKSKIEPKNKYENDQSKVLED